MPPAKSLLKSYFKDDYFDLSFKIFHELMVKRVREILLISSPYDAFIMEEDGRFAERVIHEYRGLNLSHPPRFTWVANSKTAIETLKKKKIDLVITIPFYYESNPHSLGREIKNKFDNIPFFILTHDANISYLNIKGDELKYIDRTFVWSGNSDLFLAIIKSVEDQFNVEKDTRNADVRVIIFVEDSPKYISSMLPLLYKEIVLQTQSIIEESINEEHRLLRMRARPKILVANNFEDAVFLYKKYTPYLLNIFSDISYPKNNKLDNLAGKKLFDLVKKETPDLPFLFFSSDETYKKEAIKRAAVFLDKNSPSLHSEIRSFMTNYLGFGDFIFRLPNGKEVARAKNLLSMENLLPTLPDECIHYHAVQKHISTWLMARSEIQIAKKIQSVEISDFSTIKNFKEFLIFCIHERRKLRQKGIVIDFSQGSFDPGTDFYKIGKGSIGGKARGLAFMETLFKKKHDFHKQFPTIKTIIPKTLVISTDHFDSFIDDNNLKEIDFTVYSDKLITELFLRGKLRPSLSNDLGSFLTCINYPLAIRSSSLLEDAQFQPYAGIYNTYMIPNCNPNFLIRVRELAQSIKLVYASTYLKKSRSFSGITRHRFEEEKMAVIIQQLIGQKYGDYFYPAISGVAQSYNYYPTSYMKPEEGIAHIALGLGKTVVEGGEALRFSPLYPQFLPQFSSVDDILKNSQNSFFALKLDNNSLNYENIKINEEILSNDINLEHISISDPDINIDDHDAIKEFCSIYNFEDHKIRDYYLPDSHLVITFSNIIKYRSLPLAEVLREFLILGQEGIGSPVEIEFAVNLPQKRQKSKNRNEGETEFALLQIRPMGTRKNNISISIDDTDIENAVCLSHHAMGNGIVNNINDIIFVKPNSFKSNETSKIAYEIGEMNKSLIQANKKFLLIGPGRWGTADQWLGIPVDWKDISQVQTIIETYSPKISAEPSQGTHFFHNMTSLGIHYITINDQNDYIKYDWLNKLSVKQETKFVKHIEFTGRMTIKVDGKSSKATISYIK